MLRLEAGPKCSRFAVVILNIDIHYGISICSSSIDYFISKKNVVARSTTQVIEYLFSKCEVLSSIVLQ
jgi:hypothetical protein